MEPVTRAQMASDLAKMGVRRGGMLLVHSSLKATGAADAEAIIAALLDALGPEGTLLLPALTYLQDPPWVHDTRNTPVCIGWVPEYFRRRPGTVRSLHPTHSVCAAGARAEEITGDHRLDTTPCGPNSPFTRNLREGGQILMLGCGLAPNTSMHAIEEIAGAPYALGKPAEYTLTDASGRTFRKVYTPHGFGATLQQYPRVRGVLREPDLRSGMVGRAGAHLMDAAALLAAVTQAMRSDPYHFVDPPPPETDGAANR